MNPLHPVPVCELVSGHEQCPRDFGVQDAELVRVCSGSLMGNIILLVARYNPSNGSFERTRSSCQFFSGLELGWSHLAGNGTARFLNAVATQLPEVAAYAWGEEAKRFADLEQAKAWCASMQDANALPAGVEWFTAGWYQIAPRGDVQAVYLRSWSDPHLTDVVAWMSANGLRKRQTLAAGVRARNTGADFKELKSRVAQYGEEKGLSGFLDWWNTQGKETRSNIVRTWPAFQGDVATLDTASLIAEVDFGTGAPVWPAISGAVAVSSGAPTIAQTAASGGGVSKRNAWIIGGAIAAVGAVLGAAWWLVPSKKKSRRRRRR